ncbi:MAG: exo-alpha-sialidase [Opitutales bacterium]|nr:exo-alpha-sialidase [Opitutales bacterium]
MPHPTRFRNCLLSAPFRGLFACGLLAFCTLPLAAGEVPFTGTGSASWNVATNWSGGNLPSASEVAVLSEVQGDTTIGLNAHQTVAGMRITNRWNTVLRAGGGGNRSLTLGAEGIRLEPGAGPLIIGVDESNERVPVIVAASQTWMNQSTHRLTKMAGGGATEIGSHTLTFDGAGEIEFLSAITGSGGRLSKDGRGTLLLPRSNSGVTGGFTLNAGTVVVGHNSALGSGPLVISGGRLASLDDNRSLSNAVTLAGDFGLNGFYHLSLSGLITLSGEARVSVSGYKEIINPTDEDARFLPLVLTLSGRIADGGADHGLTKDGPATLVLGGANTYGGPTTVNEGLLAINGDQSAATGAVTVGERARLGGTGRIGGAVTVRGALVPGHAGAGTLSLAGDLDLASNAILRLRANANGMSRLQIAGTLHLEPGASLEIDGRDYRGTSASLLLVEAAAITGDWAKTARHVDFPANYTVGLRRTGTQLYLDIERTGDFTDPAPQPAQPVLDPQLRDGELTLSLRSRIGSRYRVEHSPDLVQWSERGDRLDGTDTNLRISGDPVHLSGSAAFYRTLATDIPQVIKTDLFREGDYGIVSYRIPGIVVTAAGTVLAYGEARVFSGADLGEIEIHLRRSTDGGRTFSEPVQIAHRGPRLPRNPVVPPGKEGGYFGEPDEQTVNNPMAIAAADGTVHFVYCVEYYRVFYMRSDDDGLTWSEPVEITHVFDEFRVDCDWQYLATGPGHGIELSNGRLLVPIRVDDFRTGAVRGFISTIFSDDGGQTWQRGEIALRPASEAMLTERADGSVLLTARNPRSRKAHTTSPDGVTGWTPIHYPEELLEPGCMASLVTHPGTADHPGPFIIFSNPHTTLRENRNRKDVSLKVSRDGGQTWPVHRILEHGPSAYSDLAVLPDGTILCFYESGHPDLIREGRDWPYAVLRLAHIPPEWLCGED